jgi:hypothetical protein
VNHPLRIQRLRARGWRKPVGAVYVGRPTAWGNPFETAREFRMWLNHCVPPGCNYHDFMRLIPQRDAIEQQIENLRGKQLLCWCRLDQECHADVLCELANSGGL